MLAHYIFKMTEKVIFFIFPSVFVPFGFNWLRTIEIETLFGL